MEKKRFKKFSLAPVNYLFWLKTVLLLIILVVVWNLPLLSSLVKSNYPQEITNTSNLKDQTFYYPRLNIEAPIISTGQLDPFEKQYWPIIQEGLKKGISLNVANSEFEKKNSAYLIGHSTDTYPHRYSSVFAPLSNAQKGDQLILKVEGREYRYLVAEKKILDPQDKQEFRRIESNKKQQVVLVTCWPLYSTKKRLVVIGEKF